MKGPGKCLVTFLSQGLWSAQTNLIVHFSRQHSSFARLLGGRGAGSRGGVEVRCCQQLRGMKDGCLVEVEEEGGYFIDVRFDD